MEKGLDIPLAERLSILFLSMLYSLSHTRAHTHTQANHAHIYLIYILAAKNAREFEQKTAPLNGERCPSFGNLNRFDV